MTRRCPLCRRETTWDDNPWRPFCSERCQIIDLGNWASDGYGIPMAETPDGVTPAEFIDLDRESSSDEER
jgi:endogenous inhibitor of DNA gyrase (YacG/DUF329 family)